MKRFAIKNKYTKEIISFNTRYELDDYCNENGIKLNTLERAHREGRESLTGWGIVDYVDPINKTKTVLFIGDIHAPFTKEGYLEFCKEMYEKHNCDTVVFAGDIIDNHALSYHENHQDAYGAKYELELAKKEIAEWHKTFPNAYVMIGNHDSLVNRKAQTSGIPKAWIKGFNEVLNVDGWTFLPQVMIDNVLYLHGTGRIAKTRCMQDNVSVAQGHYHSDSYIQYFVGHDGRNKFALQVGCGVDAESYAMAYGRAFAKPHINVAIIKDGQAFLEYMR